MQNMDYYYDFSGQKFGYPLSLSINGFSRAIFSKQDSLEISYVLKGKYEAVTSQFSVTLEKRDMIVIAPDEIHLLRPMEDGIILTIHIDFSRMHESMAGDYHNRFVTDVYSIQRNQKTYIQLRHVIGMLAEELMEETHNLYHMNAIMMELLYITSSVESFELPLHTEYYENYIKAIKYIDEHYREDITLTTIADQLSFSPSYASKMMKKYMGIPFVKYVSYVRIRASLESLLEGKQTIEKIALDCGMPNSKSYTATFKELYGISPSAYRKQFQENMKFSHTNEKKKMRMDDCQKQLLKHLISEKEILYKNENIEIFKEEKDITLVMDSAKLIMDTTPDGKMIARILFS